MRTITSRSLLLSAALTAAALVMAACGGEDETDATEESTLGGDGMLSAYVSCIEEQGIDLSEDWAEGFGGGGEMPSFDPENAPTDMPSGMPTDMPSGGFGGAGGFEAPEGVSDEDWQAAQDACAGDFPGGGAPGGSTGADDLAAYRDCLAERGVELGDDPAALDDTDPDVAAAMEACAALAPDTATDTES
jgi:hypothetical protein